MDKVRRFHFSFEEYYDIIIWDSSPGRTYSVLQRKLEEVSAGLITPKSPVNQRDEASAIKYCWICGRNPDVSKIYRLFKF
jgi:hypothetical protein